jgi:hypothetical protein
MTISPCSDELNELQFGNERSIVTGEIHGMFIRALWGWSPELQRGRLAPIGISDLWHSARFKHHGKV